MLQYLPDFTFPERRTAMKFCDMAYTRQGGTRTFTELLKNAGLDSPFDETCLRRVCETAGAWLESFDLSGIE